MNSAPVGGAHVGVRMKVKEYFDKLAADLDSLAWNVGTAPWADWAWGVVEEEVGPPTGRFIVDLGAGRAAPFRTSCASRVGRASSGWTSPRR